jgi:hypothetical protein
MSKRSGIVTVSLVVFAASCMASSHVNAENRLVDIPQCPKFLAAQHNITSMHDGWIPVGSEKPHFLKSVHLSVNDPRNSDPVLLPHERNWYTVGAESFGMDLFDPLPSHEGNVQDIWVMCKYEAVDVMLIKKLPKGAAQCAVMYTDRSGLERFPLKITLECYEKPILTAPP